MTHVQYEPIVEAFEPAPGFTYFQDTDSVAPLMHPLRRRAYIEAVKAPVSAKELAARLEVPLQRMSYHVRLLADAGLLRVVRRTPRRGAMETHYRAVATFEFSDAAVARSSPETIAFLMESDARILAEDLVHAIGHGATAEEGFILARAHFVVDAAGRRRLDAELREIYRRLEALEQELRVAAGEDAVEVNVLLAAHLGRREGGRNGPVIAGLSDDFDTIPAE
jgi:predicted ArsR family transcriptional regulator